MDREKVDNFNRLSMGFATDFFGEDFVRETLGKTKAKSKTRLLKLLTGAINRIDRAGASPGARRRRADGRIWVKESGGGWAPEQAPTSTKAAKATAAPSKVEKVLPSPSGGESQDKFVSRCMSWMDDNEGDRPQDQRLAMCFRQFREEKEHGEQALSKDDLLAEAQQNAGYLVKLATRLRARKQKQDEDGARTRMEGPLENLTSETIQK